MIPSWIARLSYCKRSIATSPRITILTIEIVVSIVFRNIKSDKGEKSNV